MVILSSGICKFNVNTFLCLKLSTAFFQIELNQPLVTQGPFDAIVHKVTDILAKSDNGNLRARQFIQNIQVIHFIAYFH